MTNDFDLASYLDEKINPEDIPELDYLYGDAWFEAMENWCESPIEKILYCFLLIEKPKDCLVLLQQELATKGGNKRVDFIIGLRGVRGDFRPMFIIEADGEDFHTTTQQIANDKRRDREILAQWGLPTIRYPGKEIMSDPESVRVEVHQIFRKGRNL